MIRFGTGGWRAIIGEDFIKRNVCLVTEGICALMREEGKTDRPLMLGWDNRFLSDTAAVWMAEVFAANGITVWMTDCCTPTPMVMHTVMREQLFYGVEITASHNPAAYNGIKLIVEEGRDAPLETTARLEALIDEIEAKGLPSPAMPLEKAVEQGLVCYRKNPLDRFIGDILSVMDTERIRERGSRVLFDPMYGSGYTSLLTILNTAGCEVDVIHNYRDAHFGGRNPAPAPETLGELRERVVAGGYELGIALDGDGDRLGIIDASGRYLSANEILVMLYWYLHEVKGWQGGVVRNLATTHMLDVMAADFGEVCREVPVGFKYVSAGIDEIDAVLGGESSGGLTVRGHIHGKDSVYAASLFVEMISVTGKSPSALIDELERRYGHFEMVEDNITFDPAVKGTLQHIIFEQKALPAFDLPIARVSYEDGCKVCFDDNSFVICRFSGTEPLLRIFAEARDAATARTYIKAFRELLSLERTPAYH